MTNFVPDQLVKWTERASKSGAVDSKKLRSLALGNLSAKRSGKLCVVTAHLDSWEDGFTDVRRFAACDEGECDARLQINGKKMFSRICRDKVPAVPKYFDELGAAAAASWPQKEWIDKSSISTEKAGTLALPLVASAPACVFCSYQRRAIAVEVRWAIDAASAMQVLLQISLGAEQPKALNTVAVDPGTGTVSYQQNDCCILFGLSGIQFVKACGLPSTFISVQQAKVGYIFHSACQLHDRFRLSPPFRLYTLYLPAGREASRVQRAAFISPYLMPLQHLSALRLCLYRTLITRITEKNLDRKRQKVMASLMMARLKSIIFSRLLHSSSSSGVHKRRKTGHD